MPVFLTIQNRTKKLEKKILQLKTNMKTEIHKLKTAAVAVLFIALGLSANAQDISSSFTNIDFDSGTVSISGHFDGFDDPSCEIIGWNDLAGCTDAGVEGPGAWWNPYNYQAGFIIGGGSAYNLGNYTIQAGDSFFISFMAKCWEWTGADGQWTATLFYDNPANVIGSYVTPSLSDNSTWTAYASTASIAATAPSVGHQLGIIMNNTGTRHACMDSIAITVVPEPAMISLVAVAGLGMLLRYRRFVK
jgi:hypothetical protein